MVPVVKDEINDLIENSYRVKFFRNIVLFICRLGEGGGGGAGGEQAAASACHATDPSCPHAPPSGKASSSRAGDMGIAPSFPRSIHTYNWYTHLATRLALQGSF